jgi:hypothetical protein
MLSKDVAEPACSLFKRGHAGHSAVDPGPCPAVGGNLSRQNDLFAIVKEHRLNQSGSTGWNQTPSRLTPENQVQRIDKQRLACTGLPGQRGQSLGQDNTRIVNDSKPANMELNQHGLLVPLAEALSESAPHMALGGGDHVEPSRVSANAKASTWLECGHGSSVEHAHHGSLPHDLEIDLLVSSEDHAAVDDEVRRHGGENKRIQMGG